MIYVGIMIVFVVMGIAYCIKEGFSESIFEYFMNTLSGLVFGAVAGAVISVALALIVSGVTYTNHMHLEREYKIVALQDNVGTKGQTMLGSGSFDSEMKYVFMSEEENGAQMRMISAEDAVIKYSGETKVDKYSNDFRSVIMKKLFWGNMFAGVRYQVFVPEGTIQQNYNVDLK